MNADCRELLNRPLLESDLREIVSNEWALRIRDLVLRYRQSHLPVMNGGFRYSNLLEGPSQVLTCNPYRLWEYSSLFLALDETSKRDLLLDLGGAGAPLAYVASEFGYRVLSVDLQPALVAIVQHVAAARSLSLEARVADVVTDLGELDGSVGTVAFVSVLEHIQPDARPQVFEAIFRLLRRGGILYMTFDYGNYTERDSYVQKDRQRGLSRSIDSIGSLAAQLRQAGFRFRGNDPELLPATMLQRKQSPGAKQVIRNLVMTTDPFDAETPWRAVLKYLVRRLFFRWRRYQSRFESHNFFRMYLEKP